MVHSAEPPWIAGREAASAEADAARRLAFDQELINAMSESLRHRHGFEADIQTKPPKMPRTALPQDATRT